MTVKSSIGCRSMKIAPDFFTVDSGDVFIAVLLFVCSAGIGLAMTPATDAIMGALPPDQFGVGSAVNDTTREIGGALGIAILGSLFAASYADRLRPQLPADVPEEVARIHGYDRIPERAAAHVRGAPLRHSRVENFFRARRTLLGLGLDEVVTPSLVGGSQSLLIGNIVADQFRGIGSNWSLGAAMAFVVVAVMLIAYLVVMRLIRWVTRW